MKRTIDGDNPRADIEELGVGGWGRGVGCNAGEIPKNVGNDINTGA